MKTSVLQSITGLLTLFLTFPLFSQITITSSDLANYYAAGREWFVSTDAESGMYNIGSTGGGNTWNFNGIVTPESIRYATLDPGTTPLANEFPDATAAVVFTLEVEGTSSEAYSYFKITDQAFSNLGGGGSISIEGFEGTSLTTYSPEQPFFEFPINFGDSFTYEGTLTSSTALSGFPSTATETMLNDTTMIDAYGTLIFPDGSQAEALRVKQISVTNSEIVPGFPTTTRSVSYSFVAKNGASVSVTLSAENGPNEGMVEGSLSWTGPSSMVTSTFDITKLGYDLKAAYPNPFKDQTLIQYTLPENTNMELSIMNIEGQVVRTLENGLQQAGNHQLTFDAAELASGVYFLRLNVKEGVLTQKLVLTK